MKGFYVVFFFLATALAEISNSPAGLNGAFKRLSVDELTFSDGSQFKGRIVPSLGSRNNPALSCSELVDNVPMFDGIYWLMPPGGSASDAYRAYCDLTTDGGGWTLLFKITQNGGTANLISEEMFESVFKYAQWISGTNVSAPLNPSIPSVSGRVSIESVNWANFFVEGSAYQLRQTGFKASGRMDQYFDLVFPGFFLQDDVTIPEHRAWQIFNRTIIEDTTGISWNNPEGFNMYFAPPFTANFPYGTRLYAGCGGYRFDFYACGHFSDEGVMQLQNRRVGCAGIMFDLPSRIHEIGFSWMPQLNGTQDVLYCRIAMDVFGTTGGDDMAGLYWVRDTPSR